MGKCCDDYCLILIGVNATEEHLFAENSIASVFHKLK